MSDIELVIKIDEELYKNKKGYLTIMDAHMICDAVANGTVIPKGHGRIIDESKITKLYTYVPNSFCKGGGWKTEDFNATCTDAPTIIEGSESE